MTDTLLWDCADTPLVTVLLPTYNRAELLRAAIQSAVSQTYQNLEVVILDDASLDWTEKTAAEFSNDPRVQYVRHSKNLGIPGNWKAGIERARGKFFCLLHDDDTFEPAFVERLLEPMLADKTIILTFCDHWVMNETGERDIQGSADVTERFRRHLLPAGKLSDFASSALVASSIPIGAALFRKSKIDGRFINEQAKGSIDSWLLYQCVRTGCAAYYCPERLMNYRVHPGGMSASMPLYMAEGHLFRYRQILADPKLTQIHAKIAQLMTITLTAYGVSLLVSGQRTDARYSLQQSLRVRPSLRAASALVLSCLGSPGTQIAKSLRSARRAASSAQAAK